jgi:hypothetical protein
MKKKIGYKVVWVKESTSEMFSCILRNNYGGMKYQLNKVTERKNNDGPLAVFKTLKSAKKLLMNAVILTFIKY